MTESVEPLVARIQAIDPSLILRKTAGARPLWWLGGPLPGAGPRVAIIGSRRATPAALRAACELGAAITRLGGQVVTGGAEGVDAEALIGALGAGGGPVAVLPGPVDQPYPPVNTLLFERVGGSGGGLLSACPPGTSGVVRGRFLGRNVLMTRLVDAVIAVSAGTRSGSLHCAAEAWAIGLPVLAVPWSPGTANTEGSNALLAAGARAIWDADGCRKLVESIAHSRQDEWLGRDRQPPGRGGSLAPPLALDGEVQQHNSGQDIDGGANPWQCYERSAVRAGTASSVPDGCDAGLVGKLAAALQEAGAAGLTLEELAHATTSDRGVLANTALRLVLSGQLRRTAGGLFVLPSRYG